MNTLLKNYFEIYDERTSEQIEKYTTIVKNHIFEEKTANNLINDLISSDKFFSYNKSEDFDASISFKLITLNEEFFSFNFFISFPALSLSTNKIALFFSIGKKYLLRPRIWEECGEM